MKYQKCENGRRVCIDARDEDSDVLNLACPSEFLHAMQLLKAKPSWQLHTGSLILLHLQHARSGLEGRRTRGGRKAVLSPLIGTLVEVFVRRNGGVPGAFKPGVIENVADELNKISGTHTKITTVMCVRYDDGTCAKRVDIDETMWRVLLEATVTESDEVDSQATETESENDEVDSQATETEIESDEVDSQVTETESESEFDF